MSAATCAACGWLRLRFDIEAGCYRHRAGAPDEAGFLAACAELVARGEAEWEVAP
jgi:hypothetical protein